MVCDPEAFVVALLLGSDSHTTCNSCISRRDTTNKGSRMKPEKLTLPSVSFRMNLYSKVVLGGRFTVIVHTGYVADDSASCKLSVSSSVRSETFRTDAAGSQVPNCEILPTRKMF